MIVPSSATSTGLVHPHSRIDEAIWLTCASLWVRALRANGIRRSVGQRSTWSAGHLGFPAELAATSVFLVAARRRGLGRSDGIGLFILVVLPPHDDTPDFCDVGG